MAMDTDMAPINTQAPDSDTETPPINPSTKRAHHSNNIHAPGVSYKECMKNHAATMGGHALDGCCEFMPGPTFNPSDPTSLKCAACGCHRNFHSRDPDDPTPLNHHLLLTAPPARRDHSPPSASHLLLSVSHSPSGPSDEIIPTAVNAAAAVGGAGVTSGGMLVGYGSGGGGQNGNFTSGSSSSSKKRFRTKFTQEQKEKMYEFSEKIGWKLKKGEEKLVEDFVKEIGVGRSVFKVWMHNNKHISNKHNPTADTNTNTNTSSLITSTTTSIFGYEEDEHVHKQQRSTGHDSNNAGVGVVGSGGVGNCGASVVVNHHRRHHHQFDFVNGAEARAQ